MDESYSHGWIVPLVSAYFAWQHIRTHQKSAGELSLGLCAILTGSLIHLAAVVLCVSLLDLLALVLMLYGLAVLVGGLAWARGFRFALVFLFFMCPLPVAVAARMALWLQGVVTPLATMVLQLFLPASQEGNIIYLPGQQLEVGESCSGLRQIMAFVALALILLHVGRRGWLGNSAVLVAALPVAILANLFRVLLMALVLRWGGPEWVDGAWHSAWGMVTMAIGVALFATIGLVLNERQPTAANPQPPCVSRFKLGRSELLSVTAYWRAGVICLGATLVAQVAILDYLETGLSADPPSLREPLESFPRTLQGWTSQDLTPERLIPAAREFYREVDDRLYRTYELRNDPDPGMNCSLWIVYARDGRDRSHHPLNCYKSSGYSEDPAGRGEVDVEGRTARIKRFAFLRRGSPHFVYYWHYTLEPMDAAELAPLRLLHQRLRRHLPSVTVEVFTGAATSVQREQTEQFLREVDRRLAMLLPPGARLGSDSPPILVVGPPRHGIQDFGDSP